MNINYKSPINIVFTLCFLITTLIIFGYLPREFAFVLAFLYYSFLILSPTEQGVSLIIRAIPLFIALPLTDSFDNFNIWRLAILIIFIKWGIEGGRAINLLKNLTKEDYYKDVYKNKKLELYGSIFLFFTSISFLVGVNTTEAIIRIIYIFNIVAFFVVIRSLVIEKLDTAKRFFKDTMIGVGIALLFGLVQLILAYFTHIELFHFWWAQEVSVNQFGKTWGNIVWEQGNTWFSYSGDILRLRMFSIFPDTHSFPMYIVMGIPAFFTLLFLNNKLSLFKDDGKEFLKKITPRTSNDYALVFLSVFAFLSIILSGTRGIWVAFLLPMVLVLLWFSRNGRVYSKYVLLSFIIFFTAMMLYIGIGSFRQFQTDGDASLNRLRSVFDLGETSNSGRIHIWGTTIKYIAKEPIWGVGVANYPFILSENMTASLAGSSAHNIYLHIASTTGIPSAIFFLLLLYELIKRGLRCVKNNKKEWYAVYQVATVFSVLWLAMYLMTDSAFLTHERFLDLW